MSKEQEILLSKELESLRSRMVSHASQLYKYKKDLASATKNKDAIMIDFFLSLIVELDSIEQAEQEMQNTPGVPGEMEGIYQAIKQPLLKVLTKYGVTKLEPPVNQLPDFSKVVKKAALPNRTSGEVLRVLKNGYVWGTKVVRYTELEVVE